MGLDSREVGRDLAELGVFGLDPVIDPETDPRDGSGEFFELVFDPAGIRSLLLTALVREFVDFTEWALSTD